MMEAVNDKRHGRRNPAIHAILLIMAAVMVLVSGCSVRERQSEGQRGEGRQADEARETAEGMPIVRDRIALTFFTGQSPNNIGPYEDKLVWKKMAERSNMDIRFRLIPFEILANQRALALAGEEWPDAFYSARLSSAELYMYGRKGVLIPLDDYLADHAPNFYALLERYPELRQGLTMPDGHIYSFPSFYDPEFLAMLVGMPFWVNGKWLERLGMKEPVTTDELLAYLRAARDTDLNSNGVQDEIPVASVGITPLLDQLKGAFGLGNRGIAHRFVDVDEETIRWMDYFFGEEGATLFFMGEEGITYDKKPDGSLAFKESIAQAEGGLTLDQALIPYVTWMGGSYPGFVREAYFQGSETRPEAMASAEKARPYIPTEVWGRFNFTEEESLWMSTAGRDIERYANEAEREFVNGTLPLSEWETYVSRLEAMGLDQYMNIYEQAYERYEATLR
jgi:ABC-type glycerol-3-phosphate transport system substrate-binding protein